MSAYVTIIGWGHTRVAAAGVDDRPFIEIVRPAREMIGQG